MLKQLLEKHGITAADLAKAVTQTGGHRQGRPFGRSAMAMLINRGVFPKATPIGDVVTQVENFLKGRGIPRAELKGLWAAGGAAAQGKTSTSQREDKTMLPRKSSLTQQAKKYFKLSRAPFGDVESDDDMLLSPNVRYAREFLLDAMRNGGFKALVGESGAGKTTLMEECEEHVIANELPVTLIRPFVTGMDTDEGKGSPLRARSILLHILDSIAPTARRPSSLPLLTAEVHRQLADRHGKRQFCLVIDDAHRLSGPTLNHLKDFYELKVGRKRLLGIVLLGQLRLGQRLDPHNPEVIQITQRCEIHTLPPLDADLRDYLERRLKAVGKAAPEILAEDAYEAIRAKLTGSAGGGGRKQVPVNLAYPLAVNNLVTAAMNIAAEFGSALVTADVVREV